jgi:hypothetical protein
MQANFVKIPFSALATQGLQSCLYHYSVFADEADG